MKRFVAVAFVMAFVAITIGCAKRDSEVSPVFERLLLKEAQESAVELFGETFDSNNARIILQQQEINDVLQGWNVDPKSLPERVQQALKDSNTVGLLITKMQPVGDKTPKKLSEKQRFMMEYWFARDAGNDARARGGAYWVSSDITPCPGGRDFCKHCTGCFGKSTGGLLDICVCTSSCNICRDCPRCPRPTGSGDPIQ